MTTIFAGYEQMASIMYWLIVHYAERSLRQISGGGVKQYLNEVIRLHSPIWTIMRRLKDDVCVEHYVLPKDCVIITSPWLMARNPNYFPEPGSFRPERWNEPVDTFAFFPFSHGLRVCKGERFVRTAMYVLLHELAGKQRITCDTPTGNLHLINVSATPMERLEVSLT
jgi:cytochrome P450